jgi:diaminohydroxyphosphoribosylaminopyrimidine deaminase / 5-amino-6-(5-phosphoribosylamino)uracil reductase
MHEKFLQLALAEARKHQGFCAPNPAVGAVAVIGGEAVATGTHEGPGTPHAEVMALRGLTPEQWRRATLYVSLEPCCHHGRTPPCTDLILQHGVGEVVYGFTDPNPAVAGKGRARLEAAGVRCTQIDVASITEFYSAYARWWRTGNARLTAKLAVSLDGKIAGAQRTPVAITGEAARIFTHEGRLRADAILTTAQTIIHDDPMLNVRLDQRSIAKPVYVLDRLGRLPWTAKVIQTAKQVTLFHGIEADECRLQALERSGVRLVRTPGYHTPEIQGLDLKFITQYLGKTEGLHDIWIEAGGRSFTQFLTLGLLDRAYLILAMKWLGPDALPAFDVYPTEAFGSAKSFECSRLGTDTLLEWKWDR